jgi:hypothetical protein
LIVGRHSAGVAHNLGVSGDPRLCRRVALGCLAVGAAPPGRVASRRISLPVSVSCVLIPPNGMEDSQKWPGSTAR